VSPCGRPALAFAFVSRLFVGPIKSARIATWAIAFGADQRPRSTESPPYLSAPPLRSAASILGVSAAAGGTPGPILFDPLLQHGRGASRTVVSAVHVGAQADIAIRRSARRPIIARAGTARQTEGNDHQHLSHRAPSCSQCGPLVPALPAARLHGSTMLWTRDHRSGTVRLHAHWFSRPSRSTTPAPLRGLQGPFQGFRPC